MTSDQYDGVIEYDGEYFCAFDDEFWVWEPDPRQWIVLDTCPPFLKMVNGRLAKVNTQTGRHYCNCPKLVWMNRGCQCGGD